MYLEPPLVSIDSPICKIKCIIQHYDLRDRQRIKKDNGDYEWDKYRGGANITLESGDQWYVELHWYEYNNIRREIKIKIYFNRI